jgi:hypothetical protein
MGKTALMPPRALALLHVRFAAFLLVLLASFLLFLVSTSTASAAKPCWERVVDDWVDNGRIDGAYSPACLQAALQNVPEDVRAYSDFEERVKQARQDAFRNRLLQGRSSEPPTSAGTSRGRGQEVKEVEPRVREPDGPIPSALRRGTTDASTIPLPLIILAALAFVLMTAGAAGVMHRKLRARRASGPR